MLYLKWENLKSRNLQSGLEKIRNSTKIEEIAAYRAGRVTEKIAQEQDKAHQLNIKLLKKWAKKDDRGHLVPVPNSDDFEFSEGDKEKYVAELEPLAMTEFVIKANAIDFSTIKGCGLTPGEIVTLVDMGIVTEPTP